MSVKSTLPAGLLALGATLSACAAPEPPLPEALKTLQQQGVEVVRAFDAPSDLQGYIINAGGQMHAIYVTGDGKHVMLGALVDAQGTNLTERHLDRYAPQPDLSKAWDKLENTRWVADGAENPKRIVYVLADPYCPYCRAFWIAAQPYEKVGLQVRWVWVSYLRPDGPARAAAILEADDPAAAMAEHESRFAEGGIEPAESPKPETLQAIRAHTNLMRELGVNGTPAVFYKDEQGKVRSIQGMPKLGALPKIFGLPEQPNDDPALARFR